MENNLQNFYDKISERAKTYIGYPVATDYDYTELYPFLQYSINNVGDPFVESNICMFLSNGFFLDLALSIPNCLGTPSPDSYMVSWLKFLIVALAPPNVTESAMLYS